MQYIELINGVRMPKIGLGTYPMNGDLLKNVVKKSDGLGYKLYDSAHSYKNEKILGETLRSLSVDRSNVFVTSKVKAYQYLGRRRYLHIDKKSISKCYSNTLKEFGFNYLDLFLLHSNIDFYMHAYKEMIELYEQNK